MVQFSLTPVLLGIEIGFVFLLALRCGRLDPSNRNMKPVYVYLSFITAYAIATSVLGARGVFISKELLQLLPGLWLQTIIVLICVLPIVFFDSVRSSMRRIVDLTPWHWFAYFHGLRIAALGTAYKTYIGEFPVYFEWLVGVPDLLFGISAFWIAPKVKHGEIGARGFMVWNLIGAFIIVPAAAVLLQLGLPGPLQVFKSLPDARTVFTYPMSIAPMAGVPLFVLINLWVAWRLWERTRKLKGDNHKFNNRRKGEIYP